MLLLIVFLGLSFSVRAEPNNIALRKPVSSSHISYGGVPERANDGNPDTTFSHASCMMADETAPFPLPWWQVNLEGDYYIYSVALTNRGDAYTFRLRDFTVEVYSENPTTNPEAPVQVCASFPGTVGAAVREVLVCSPGVRGQYLRVQKKSIVGDDALHICEAEVFGKFANKAPRAMYSRFPGQRLPGTPLSQDTGTAAECGRICFHMPLCDGFNFDGGFGGGTGTCQFMFQQEAPVSGAGYDCYTPA